MKELSSEQIFQICGGEWSGWKWISERIYEPLRDYFIPEQPKGSPI